MKFTRKDITKKKRIANTGWRKPKGITNKKRLNKKGHSPNVRTGYGTPNKEKNKINGLQIIKINNLKELSSINPKIQAITIGKTGKQKKLQIIKKAEEQKITIINFQTEKYKQETEKFFAEREKLNKNKLEQAKKKQDEKIEKEKQKKKQDEQNKNEEKELTLEEKQKIEKQEKDKILTKSK